VGGRKPDKRKSSREKELADHPVLSGKMEQKGPRELDKGESNTAESTYGERRYCSEKKKER